MDARTRRCGRLARAVAGPVALAAALVVPSLGTTHDASAGTARSAVPGCRADAARTAGARGTLAEVRTPQGQVRVVSFERGWAVFNGRAPGTFLRVCHA